MPLPNITLLHGDCIEVLKSLDSASVDCVVTSPPYWRLRDYGVAGQLGHEPTVGEYVEKLCDVFDEIRRILKSEGTCWVNLGDSYNATKATHRKVFGYPDLQRAAPMLPSRLSQSHLGQKCLLQVPSRFAIAMCERGWILRNEIIWHKPNAMPSGAKDRFTIDYEKVFFFTKSSRYAFNQEAVLESLAPSSVARLATNVAGQRGSFRAHGGRAKPMKASSTNGKRNKRCVWSISTTGYKEVHFATFPEKLVEAPILAGCPLGGTVLDPFSGTGTTGLVARKLGRQYIGIELNKEYIELATRRLEPFGAQ